MDGIEYNETFGEYIAVAMTGKMVFGQTRQECYDNLREANRAWIEHCQKCQDDREKKERKIVEIGTQVRVREGVHRCEDGRIGVVDEIYENYPDPLRYHIDPDPVWGDGATFWYFACHLDVVRPSILASARAGKETNDKADRSST